MFPRGIWKDIFTRLPVKVILQMRLVCKQFHLLISDPDFRAAHVEKSRNDHKLLLRHFSDKERPKKHHYLMLNDEHKKLDVKNSEEIKFPLRVSRNPNSWIVGSLEGFVCLSKGYSPEDEIVLWNPSIRKCMHIPIQKGNIKYDSNYYCVLGLGFDPKTYDYKVVRLVYLKNNDRVPPIMELFTLGSQSWRTLITNDRSSFVIHENIWPQAYLNGAVHWIGYEPNGITLGQEVISFDMADESFRKMALPDVLATENVSLSVLKNMLLVIHNEMSSGQERFSIWVMEEYAQASSWIKHYTIDLMQGKVSKMIGFRRNGEAIVATKKGQLKIYDPETERMRDVKCICGDINSFSIVSYMDSLVLLDQTGAETVI